MLDRAAWLHALNADETQAISLLKLRPPIVELANGVFLDEIRPLPPAGSFYAAYPMLAGKPFILFLSRLHPGKGLNWLAEAFAIVAKEHAEAHLVVAGPDYGAREDFERQIAQAGLGERVHLVGPIYGAAKIAAMVDAACFCLPSEHETFSMAITEAMACGTPVVISRTCHYSEVAEVGAGYVVDLDPRQIADALLRLLANPSLRQQMGDAGKSLIESRFTWPTIAQQSLLAYQRALQTPAAS
jgi:glycosyltransferase involved in cell wall biosynthesis